MSHLSRPLLMSTLAVSLPAFLACGRGGGAPAPLPAPKLAYTDPPAAPYRLMRNAALSTDGHLVLDLVGSAGFRGRGLALTLSADEAKVAWGKPDATRPELALQFPFELGIEPRISRIRIQGGEVRMVFAQKGALLPARALEGPLVRVALDLKPGATGTVSLSAAKAQVLPETGPPVDLPIATGSTVIR